MLAWHTVSRYVVAFAALGVALLFRYLFRESLGVTVPYLQFYPAIIVAAWYGGAGPGLLTTGLSALAAMYWLLPPAGLAVGGSTDLLSLGVFVATGLVISFLNHRLHQTQAELLSAVALATGRAERLDAILKMSVDGIIVIDGRGQIEAFNRGAQELFGYPEQEVLGRNVSILMPSPHHEQHDAYLQRYLTTGEAKIFTPFFTTKSRGSGLGLPTVKRLIEAHNGQVAIDCPATGGTTVVIRLPLGTA
jgi:two-component system sensor kinase FixL